MAKKRKTTTRSTKSAKGGGLKGFFSDKRVKISLGVFLIVFAFIINLRQF